MLHRSQDARVVSKLKKMPKESMWGFVLYYFICLFKKAKDYLEEHLKYFKYLKQLFV